MRQSPSLFQAWQQWRRPGVLQSSTAADARVRGNWHPGTTARRPWRDRGV